ncbi:MAG: DUF4198 domain-containing protein [Pseudomonadota bacterium]
MTLLRSLSLAFACLTAPSLAAHEFWIEPHLYQIDAGERLQADFKNGETFRGITLAFFEQSSARFSMMVEGRETEVQPRLGDLPALNVPAPTQDGLVVVVHETTSSTVTYNDWQKFLRFVAHKDFPNAAREHLEAGWPKTGFRESYTRHVKALVAVGSGAGQDQPAGLKTEFVALSNPYADGFDNDMRIQLLLDGAPRPDAQVEVFERSPSGDVRVSLHRTLSDGTAVIPVKSNHTYLFDAVVLNRASEAAQTAKAPLWQTFWAALTFHVPE